LYGSGISTVTCVSDSINPDVYKVLMKELDKTLEKQFSGNAESRAAGMVINTMGWVEGLGYEVSTLF
jgi:polyribonucleotide 5'-hydroxyl-kinase